jgi:hypothetical protein
MKIFGKTVAEIVFRNKRAANDIGEPGQPKPIPFDMKPEVARLIQDSVKTNPWLAGLAKDGGLNDYETRTVSLIESLFKQSQTMPPARSRESALLMFSGFVLVTITTGLEYVTLLEYLSKYYKDFTKEKTFELFQKFYSNRDVLNGNAYTINLEYIRKILLTPDSRTIENEKLLGFPTGFTGLGCLANTLEQEIARFTFESKVWFAVWQQMLVLGVPKPNEYNQTYQWFIDTAKEQADEVWATSTVPNAPSIAKGGD